MSTGEDMTMQSHIHFPENFPLRGIERDAFDTKLRNALYGLFDGSRVRQFADQVDARRSFHSPGVLPLCRIGDGYTFEQCMALDCCTFGDVPAALCRFIVRAVRARPGLDLTEPHFAADRVSEEGDATNRLSPSSLSNNVQHPRADEPTKPGRAVMLAATAGGAAGGGCATRRGADGWDGGLHVARPDATRIRGQRAGCPAAASHISEG
ncbi:hypothetical protein VSR68_24360 [Paraburkholderia phymatum]|uniref:hypothetical protein n=1 Tax=Paraburkholderia phymatum TaxID=148447 RepID=UPI00317AD326